MAGCWLGFPAAAACMLHAESNRSTDLLLFLGTKRVCRARLWTRVLWIGQSDQLVGSDRLSSIKWGVSYRLMILGVVTYVLVVARTGTPIVPTALGVPYDYVPAVTRVLGPTIAMSVTILKL